MSGNNAHRSDAPSISLEALQQIEDICARLELHFRSGVRQNLDNYLKGVAGDIRNELLRELLLLDIEMRRELGEAVSSSDYDYLATTADQTVVNKVFDETYYQARSCRAS
ncbi:MAG: hypothetical protein KDA60_17720, partial [Planctomycetales bacterium]|nr:hypothetical protein [Planctomycetales bacterium]